MHPNCEQRFGRGRAGVSRANHAPSLGQRSNVLGDRNPRQLDSSRSELSRRRLSRPAGTWRRPTRCRLCTTMPKPASAASTSCAGVSPIGPRTSRSASRPSTPEPRGSTPRRPSARRFSGADAWCRSTVFTNGKRPPRENNLTRSRSPTGG